jgi:filamentous hemagglutinin family protein
MKLNCQNWSLKTCKIIVNLIIVIYGTPINARQNPIASIPTYRLSNYLLAQVTPDTTLGDESSVVTPNAEVKGLPSELISGGAPRGINLFHSFAEFNVGGGQQVYFANPTGIENILTRVTGGNVSNIFGTLGVDGAANLFLLNPNGIIFGTNARLDVAGSFLASTAESALFENGVEFSAKNPQASPLLTVKMPIGLQLGNNPAPIQVNDASLEVQPNRNLALIGGNVEIDRSRLQAPEGRINLGGLSASGTVNLQGDGSFSFPDGIARSDLSLAEGSIVDVSSAIGGNIAVNARNLNLADKSILNAGIAPGLGEINARSGDIKISATDNISQSSGIQNRVNENARGNAGNIQVQTGSLQLTGGSFFSTSTFGLGNAGNIFIDASNDIRLDGLNSRIASGTVLSSVGRGGEVKIRAESMQLRDRAILNNSIGGIGDAGNIDIQTDGAIELINSNILNTVEENARGNAGDIKIRANSLSISDRGSIATLTLGKGNAGNIDIQTDGAIELTGLRQGLDSTPELFASIDSRANSNAEGNAGNIKIKGRAVSITKGLALESSNFSLLEGKAGDVSIDASDSVLISNSGINALREEGIGNAGNISINAKTIATKIGSFLDSSNLGEGDSGSISLRASSISLEDPFIRSQITGIGNAGELNIEAEDSLSMTGTPNSSEPTVTIATFGPSSGGNINLRARSITLDNKVVVNASTFDVGKGGNINVETDTLTATRGGRINANTSGAGNAGNIKINARKEVIFEGAASFPNQRGETSVRKSGTSTSVQEGVLVDQGVFVEDDELSDLDKETFKELLNDATGNAGNIKLETGKLTITNGAAIEANTSGSGNSGNVNLKVRDLFLLRNNSNISTTAGTELAGGDGGNIAIDAGLLVGLENSDITANAFTGSGGKIKIAAESILGLETRQKPTPLNDITASSLQNPQLDGIVEIISPDFDPSRGSVQLPNQPIEARVVQACTPSDELAQSEFVVTGRGGLPNTSKEILNPDLGWEDWRGAEEKMLSSRQPKPSLVISEVQASQSDKKIIEAQGWKLTSKGNIILTAQPTTARIGHSWQPPDRCQMLQPKN